jgi:hypothetical protein
VAADTKPQGLLDADAAYAVIHQRVYAPRFLEKLANDYGVRATTQEQMLRLFDMASRLRQSYDADQIKQAAARGDDITAAYAAMDQMLGGSAQGDVVQDRFRKAAAANGARDPELARAVLSLQIQSQAGAQQAAAA